MSFDTFYPSHPWEGISTNQREVYDPVLRELFMRQAVYNRFVTTQFNLGNPINTTQMTITSLLPPHANFDPIGLRQLWMPSSYIDSQARVISFERYGGKLAYHKYDNLITYWQRNGKKGLLNIVQAGIGKMMIETMDTLARNAFLDNAAQGLGYSIFGDGAASNFSGLDASADKLSTTLIQDIHLGMAERDVPYASVPSGQIGNIICITSPGVVQGIRNEASVGGNSASFIDIMKYADPSRIIRGEEGTYMGVRFIKTPRAILYNCGPIVDQQAITAAVVAGEGAAAWSSPVDGVWKVGQARPGIKNYIPVADTADFDVNDIVTIHIDRTNAFGVTNGVDFRDGTIHNRRVVSKTATQLVLDKPVMIDFNVDLGGGVYGYVTKGTHVHTAIFIGGVDGVVMGVLQPGRVYEPKTVDDFESLYRVSWDMYSGYEVFEPSVFEVWFGIGRSRVKGAAVEIAA